MRVHGCRPKFFELKQAMPSLTNLDVPFFEQWMLPGSDPRTCLIAAICGHLADLELVPLGYPHPWLWQQVNKKGEPIAEALSADNVRRSVSRFFLGVLGRTFQMKCWKESSS